VREDKIFFLALKYGFADNQTLLMRRDDFDNWLKEAHEAYRLLYKSQSDVNHWDTQSPRREDESFEEHTQRLETLNTRIKQDVTDQINYVLNDDERLKILAVLDKEARSYYTNEVSFDWQGCQEFGGTIQIGFMKRLDALEYLNKAVKEVNVLYIDDYAHFIFFRTPSIQPSK
jgi:hypothetical protein